MDNSFNVSFAPRTQKSSVPASTGLNITKSDIRHYAKNTNYTRMVAIATLSAAPTSYNQKMENHWNQKTSTNWKNSATTAMHDQQKFESKTLVKFENNGFHTNSEDTSVDSMNQSYVQQMSNKPSRKLFAQLQESASNKKFIMEDVAVVKEETKNVANPGMVHLIGYVENVIRWDDMLKNAGVPVLYNVVGKYIKTANGTRNMEKCVYIHGSSGKIMECSFYEVDRPLPEITRGQFVGCFGHMGKMQKLNLISIDILDENDSSEIRRAVSLSQRMVHELINRTVYSKI